MGTVKGLITLHFHQRFKYLFGLHSNINNSGVYGVGGGSGRVARLERTKLQGTTLRIYRFQMKVFRQKKTIWTFGGDYNLILLCKEL